MGGVRSLVGSTPPEEFSPTYPAMVVASALPSSWESLGLEGTCG